MKVTVTRDVGSEDPHNFAGRDVGEGETLYRYKGATYGCIDTLNGVALSESGPYETPFFEFPRDAVCNDVL